MHLEQVGAALGRVCHHVLEQIVGPVDEALGEEEPARELLVVAGRAHGDDEAVGRAGLVLEADTNLERLLDGDPIASVPALAAAHASHGDVLSPGVGHVGCSAGCGMLTSW